MLYQKKDLLSGRYESYLDGHGENLIDLSGGFGYQIPEVISRVVQQADHMGLSSRVLLSELLIQLCTRIAKLLPEPLASSYVCSSGDEAFEGALKLCKGLAPRRNTLVYLAGGDYGSLTYGRCMGRPEAYPEVIRFLGLKLKAVSRIEDLQAVDWSDCYAVCHPYLHMAANGRLQVPPAALLDALYEQAARVAAPVIGFDVQTCLGGLGTMFGYQRVGKVPDVVVLGGPLGGGAIPIGLYTCSQALAYKVYGRSSPAKHGSTTAGNPMSCVAALAALDYVEQNRLPERARENGRQLAHALADLGATAIGAWVTVPLAEGCDIEQLCQDLYRKGIYADPPQGAELVLRCPLSARAEILSHAATLIKETLSHVLPHAA